MLNKRTTSIACLAVLLGATLLATGTTSFAGHSRGNDVAGDHLLVQLRGGVPQDVAERIFANRGAQVADFLPQINTYVLQVAPGDRKALQAEFSHSAYFKSVGQDHYRYLQSVTPNDYWYPGQWHLQKIQAAQAWGITTGDSSVIIAVIDSGASPVSDLGAKLLPGVNLIDGGTDTSDGLNHGTPVAGLAAAITNNTLGVAGVAWMNKILPIKVYNSSGVTTCSAIASGITWAADHGARVINMSFSGTSQCTGEQSAIDYAWSKGAVLVAAAGNSSSSTPEYPAAYNNVIGVTATLQDDSLASFSDYGSWVSLAAPGCSLYTTYNSGSYAAACGTSMAAPVVSGVAGLVIAANPSLTNTQVTSLILQNADDLGTTGFDNYFGWGRVNAYRAVSAAAGVSSPPPDTTPPSASITSPAAGTTVAGTITVDVSASDNVGVAKVELYLDGALIGTDSSTPYSFAWDTTTSSAGIHTMQAVAYDGAGNSASSSTVSVTVSNGSADTNPPTVSVVSPTAGSTVSGMVTISTSAQDDAMVQQVQVFLDGSLMASASCSSSSCAPKFKWNTRKAAKGVHTLSAKAIDSAGYVGLSGSISVYR
jgi:Subtilase family/Bacterial Ig domain